MNSFADIDIKGLAADSRRVKPGYLFAALPGITIDGRTFIPDAIEHGAVAVLSPEGTSISAKNIALITDENPRLRLAQLAAEFYARQPETAVAVTGTNGKTSVAYFLHQIWRSAGYQSAAMGTLGIISQTVEETGNLTTPDPVSLHQKLANLYDHGVNYVAMEASSHGLDQFRIDGVKLSAAGFTNLSRDHLDYHGSMSTYLSAKLRLFTDVLAPRATAVVNADIAESKDVIAACEARSHKIFTFGYLGETLKLISIKALSDSQEINIELQGRRHTLTIPLVGNFQAMNLLCAAGLALATGVTMKQVTEALKQVHGAPGRLEHIGTLDNGGTVYVDYAHTPSALSAALEALRPHAKGALTIVFGAGGDRDPGKRELMGKAAANGADRIIITDDNPRLEDPALIRTAIIKGCPNAREIGNRLDAIHTAVAELANGDILLVAGKGHETGQVLGNTITPFDDRAASRTAIAAMEGQS